MTNRVNSLTVVLGSDVRDDDIDLLRNAILLLRGVIEVGTNISDSSLYTAEQRAKYELRSKIYAALS
jgi:hypothetical protein